MQELNPPPSSWLSAATGYRTLITAATAAVFNFLEVFDLVHLTDRQSTAINGLLFAVALIFVALKFNRMHRTMAATAQTGAATAREVGATVTPAPGGKVAAVLLALLLVPLSGCVVHPGATLASYCNQAVRQGWCSEMCGPRQPVWCSTWTLVADHGGIICKYRLRDGSTQYAACPRRDQ